MNQQSMSQRYPKYYKDVSGVDAIDVYAVHQLFGVDDPSGAIQHASKKLLLAGQRTGGKPAIEDIREARDTLTRYLELQPKQEPADKPSNVYNFRSVAATPPAEVELNRYVILYYQPHASRRFRPEQFWTVAEKQWHATALFEACFPDCEAVWCAEVPFFLPECFEKVHADYWNSRPTPA